MNTTDNHFMKETLSSAKKGDFEPKKKSRYLCLPNEIKFTSSLLKLWRQLYFRVKSIIFYILSKYHPSFYPNAEMFTELSDSRKEKLFPMVRKKSIRNIIDFRPKTLFPLKFSSFLNGWSASIFSIMEYHVLLPSTLVSHSRPRYENENHDSSCIYCF